MPRSFVLTIAVASIAIATPTLAPAAIIAGGGSVTADCPVVFDVPGANKPAPPKTPKSVDCVDGDATCDGDGLRNGECVFPLSVCVNSTAFPSCDADTVDSAVVDHAIDDGSDSKFDVDFQALQLRIDGLDLPSSTPDQCTLASAVTVRLKGPSSSNNKMKTNRKTVRIRSSAILASGDTTDKDKVKFTCRPEGDDVYLPTDLYTGTFDRISRQIFQQSCAVSACHDSESHTGELILLAGSAYSNLVSVTPDNDAAAADTLLRVTPGDPDASFLYRKLTHDLETDYGDPMPLDEPALSADLIELVRLWIIGDGMTGPAPETGWVEGTDD